MNSALGRTCRCASCAAVRCTLMLATRFVWSPRYFLAWMPCDGCKPCLCRTVVVRVRSEAVLVLLNPHHDPVTDQNHQFRGPSCAVIVPRPRYALVSERLEAFAFPPSLPSLGSIFESDITSPITSTPVPLYSMPISHIMPLLAKGL